MANNSNLIPMNRMTEEQQRELARKGGSTRSLAKKLAQRKYCNAKCPIYPTCWAKHISLSKASDESENQKKMVRPMCNLKEWPSRIQEHTITLLQRGEEGFNDIMMDTLLRLSVEIADKKNVPNLSKYLYELRETKKAIYGDKRRIEGSLKTGPTAEDFAEAYEASLKEHKDEKTKKTGEPFGLEEKK